MNAKILWEIRFPRTLAAAILGGALALAGYLLQTFFHNPIAGPFVLGISSGAKTVSYTHLNICFKATSNWLYVWNAEATEAFCIRFLCVQTLYLIQERVFVFVAKNMFLTYIFKNTGASPKIKRDRRSVRGGNMKKRIVAVVLASVLGAVCITGCRCV